jgi:3-hydroxypropanoate dehydrogenase
LKGEARNEKTLGDDALNEIFREARTHSAWLDKPVSDEILRQLYDLMKLIGWSNAPCRDRREAGSKRA